METINEVLKKSALHEWFGEECITELKNRIIDTIVEQIRSDFYNADNFIISPEDISQDIYEEVKNEVLSEVKEEYKKRVRACVDKKFEELGI